MGAIKNPWGRQIQETKTLSFRRRDKNSEDLIYNYLFIV